jgi:YidC/Oxa1 family membrane protein insertase
MEWRSFFRFRGLPPGERSIVFYAEDAGSWRYFEPIISHLTVAHGREICYVTSSRTDPILEKTKGKIRSFCIGSGTARTIFFLSLKADVMVMTMPDLGKYQIKRSKHPVRYLYVYHSINSTHMAYRQGAFDNYDQILCVGPHHTQEIRVAEELYGLEPKILLEGGYVILDSILEMDRSIDETPSDGPKRVLIAPSWGEQGLIESVGPELIAVLLEAEYRVTMRPHIMTIRQRHPALPRMQERFASDPYFRMDLDLASQGTVSESDIMITDWSGAAIEYALGLEKPVIFIDVPRKVNNPDYKDISLVPIEVMLRSEIGEVVPPDRLSDIPDAVERLCENPEIWQERMRELRARWIYNAGSSAEVMAAHIARAAESEEPGIEGNQ